MKIIITNISWDTDGEDIELPTELYLNFSDMSKEDIDDDFLSDYLSDTYGWCHNGFDWEYSE